MRAPVVIIGLMLAGCLFPLNASGKDISIPAPPQPVPCFSDSSCDRNPEHILSYVQKFYVWYVTSSEAYAPSYKYSDCFRNYESEDARSKLYAFIEATLKLHMTPSFWAWREQLSSENAKDRPESCGLDSDALICGQAWNLEDWLPAQSAEIKTTEQTKIVVSLNHRPSSPLIVTLKPEKRAWRIDGVKRSRN